MRDRSSFEDMAELLADRTASPPDGRDRPQCQAYVEARLEFAGCTQLALYSRVWPKGYANLWGGSAEGKRYALPTARAITMMDQAFDWIVEAIDDPALRVLVNRRCLVIPDSDPRRPRYVWSWTRLVEALGLVKTGPNVELVRRRWMAGLDLVVAHAIPPVKPLRRAA